MSDTKPLVWLYKKGSKHNEFHRKAIEEAHYSEELRDAIESGDVDPDTPVNLEEFGPTSIILPMYHTNSLHYNVHTGSIIFYHSTSMGGYYAASIVLGTGRDKDRSFVSEIWPGQHPAKTYLIFTTQPVSIELTEERFRDLFGYGSGQAPLAGQKSRFMIAPASNHQNEFERSIESYVDFFNSIRSDRELKYNWVDRKSEVLQAIAQSWR